MPIIDPFDCLSPLDHRYRNKVTALLPFLSENANVKYQALVEWAGLQTWVDFGFCPQQAATDLKDAIDRVKASATWREETKTRHDIKALTNVLKRLTKNKNVGRWLHFCFTSYDIISTANALRFRDAVAQVVIPALDKLISELAELIRREAETRQIGRSHCQHATPTTFGMAMAEYVFRLKGISQRLAQDNDSLRGKFSGAIGTYAALSLFVNDPLAFEKQALAKLDIKPAGFATQITMPEPMTDLLHDVVVISGILANLARDIRNLQRTEISEVGEPFDQKGQTGSSTMAQKKNPIQSENTDGIFKIIIGRIITVYLDLISDHQRDLTNSVTVRAYGEMLAWLLIQIKTMTGVVSKLTVDQENMKKNLHLQGDLCLAEALQLILTAQGCKNAYRLVQQMTFQARQTGESLVALARQNRRTARFLKDLPPRQQAVLDDFTQYIGLADKRAIYIASLYGQQS